MKLVLFDFDGTLTSADSFTPFIYFVCSPLQVIWGALKLLPWIVGYHLGRVDPSSMRQKLAKQALGGRDSAELAKRGVEYCQRRLPIILNNIVMAKFKQYIENGDHVVVVSASLHVYLAPWCKQHGVVLIANELEVTQGVVTGNYLGADCYRYEKKRRIQSQLTLTDYEKVIVYTDSIEDRPMVELADEGYWVNPKTQIITPMSQHVPI